MSKTYSIGELAKQFAITTRSIRFYEDEGLISPGRKGQNRVYTAKDVARLKLILRGKRLGFSINDSKELIDLYEPGTRNKKQLEEYLKKIRDKKTSLQKQVDDIRITLEELEQAENNCIKDIQEKP